MPNKLLNIENKFKLETLRGDRAPENGKKAHCGFSLGRPLPLQLAH